MKATIETVFDWQYALRQQYLLALYEKRKAATWNAADLRLLMHQVFERLGWDMKQWVSWASETPFMQGFRQMTFSKIVPNLERLGLLTPRVRAEYAKLGVLRFETMKDSVEEPEVTPPAELVRLLMQFLQENGQARGAGK